MSYQSYFHWLTAETPTRWWHDSADPAELETGLNHKACGVTTNPVLVYKTLHCNPKFWSGKLHNETSEMSAIARGEARVKTVVQNAAKELEKQFDADKGIGYVCAQVATSKVADRDAMLSMARRYHAWAPNITVKLPATAAGLDVLEECAAEGISVAATLSFTVAQVLATAKRYRKGLERAKKSGITPRPCFAVIMIGRIDDYLREIAHDRQADVSEADILQAGLAVSKQAYSIYKQENYEATLMVAALRGTHHMIGLAGADLVMSIHPDYQIQLLKDGVPREININKPMPADAIERLKTLPDFIRAYEPDGMAVGEFLSFGATQKTLSQFNYMGWIATENL